MNVLAVAVEQQLLIVPSLTIGLAIGIYESILIHRDVTVPTHRLGHTFHALVIAVIATFCTMNTAFVIARVPALQNLGVFGTPLAVQIIIGLVMMAKIHASSKAIQGSVGGMSLGLAETWTHSLIVAALVIAAPYAWPFLAPVMPLWLGGSGVAK